MNQQLFTHLHHEGYISDAELQQVLDHKHKPTSIYWDVKTLLYLGVLMLTTGLGIVIYKNIDTIGHLAIVIFIALATISCFLYCTFKTAGYSNKEVQPPNLLYEYILLAGSLLLLIFIGYIQYQYQVFGHRWGMATFVPMVILFFSAYYFDSLAVLSLAIINLAAWLGISVTPLHLLQQNDFSSERLIYTGIMLGILLMVLSFFSLRMNIKRHFSFTYKNLGTHVLFVATLSAMFHFSNYWMYLLLLVAISAFHFWQALRESSFYFWVLATIYCYIGLSYTFTELVTSMGSRSTLPFYLIFFYFILSSIGLVFFLIHYNRIIKKNDSL
ncbi:DUF2157 domain-containing protein [Aridibaculum aurantiacum]|uniref:DUF2157 domain-containing protein n=1 Tax=Aridibaculum aurantiacum TaxID=2810307 RepID=UPI001A964DFC|nr:DUF2157 domain-containing protein [Aridibaculum aurantiacum]